jgi:alkanesulfonate monooxygenase SsuD/methylene tetrahydromethanopterin reductase-like flavin-dependent oxidoreductase (luciferase family)
MHIGLSVANFAAPGGPARLGPEIAAMARRAEAAGFESLWVYDPAVIERWGAELVPAVRALPVAGRGRG